MICIKTVKQFCCEDISLIENYEEALNSPDVWDCHHRLEIQGDKRFSRRELIEMKQYYERPASELIFLTHSDHTRLHFTKFKRKEFTIEHREKLSKRKIGNKCHLGCKASNASKKKMSFSAKHRKSNPKRKQFKWLTENNEVRIMVTASVKRWHKNWKLIGEV